MKVNGWTNWDTWEANNWLVNDELAYKVLLMSRNKEDVETLFRTVFNAQHLNIDLNRVNWREIYLETQFDKHQEQLRSKS